MSNVIKIDPKNAMSYSAFGSENSTFGGGSANSLLSGDRYRELDLRQGYYDCTQHDGKAWDFDGRPISPRTMQPLLGAERSWWVPLKMRRPSMTYRLGKIIVDSFTNLLFGENRFPIISVEGDEKTEDLLQTISRVGKLPVKMIQARNLGGSMGTVGVSWCFREGRPRFEVHNAKNLFVHKWKDRLDLTPEHVSEVYLFSKVKWDGKAFNKQWYWFRRDWMPEADVRFKDVAFDPDPNADIEWEVDMERSNFHDDGVCHLEWIQNMPTDEQDGLPDYDGLYESFDAVDVIMSVISRGAIANLDPTVKLKVDPDLVNRFGITKGSDNALVVGKDGDADYMELNGSSIEAGIKLVDMKRRSILETAQCIVPDPHEVAAQGVSSVAVKTMFAPMLAKSDVLREQYGSAIERILTNIVLVLKDKLGADVSIVDGETGEESPAKFTLDLPKKVETAPMIDPIDQVETDETQTIQTERSIGAGGEVSLAWPPYFPPTPQDQGLIATALTTLNGGKPALSQETAVEAAARAYGVDPAEEWKRVQEQAKADQANQAAMFDTGAAGGQVTDPHQLPPGAEPPPGDPDDPGAAPAPTAPGGDPNDPDQTPHDVDLTGAPPPRPPVPRPTPGGGRPPFGGGKRFGRFGK